MVKIFYFLIFLFFNLYAADGYAKNFLDTKLYQCANSVTVIDKKRDEILLQGLKTDFIDSYNSSDLEIKIEFKEKKGGFDIVYHVKNISKNPVLMPSFFIPGIKLKISDNLDILSTNTKLYMQTRNISLVEPKRDYFSVGSMIYKKKSGGFIEKEFYYGADTFSPYAPVIVAKDKNFSVGASLIYPFLEYKYGGEKTQAKHKVIKNKLYPKMRIYRDKNEYRYAFEFSKKGYLKSLLSPQKSYDFVLSVRFAKPDKYIYTIHPYKIFLSKMYDCKKVPSKNLDPIMVVNFAFYGSVNKKSKRGWAWGLEKRDENAKSILPLKEVSIALSELMKIRGYKRIMFTAFSGVYDHSKAPDLFDELPFQILTNLPQNMNEELNQSLAIFKKNGQKISFWWGIAGMMVVDKDGKLISNDVWQPYSDRPFVLSNKEDKRFALRQLNRAKELNVDSLTLDAYSRMEEKSAYLWLKQMKKFAPKINFSLEMQVDYMHKLAAITLQPENLMFENVDLRYNMLTKRAELAEYLNSKGEIRVWLQNKTAGKNEREYVKKLIKLGYTPIVAYVDSPLLDHDENNVTKRVLAHPEVLTDVNNLVTKR